jgi:hypothetical protein
MAERRVGNDAGMSIVPTHEHLRVLDLPDDGPIVTLNLERTVLLACRSRDSRDRA